MDVKSLSDEEIDKKILELNKRINFSNFTGNMHVVEQMQYYLYLLNNEKRERLIVELDNQRSKLYPQVLNSDPEFNEKTETSSTSTKKEVKKTLIKRTSTPTRE